MVLISKTRSCHAQRQPGKAASLFFYLALQFAMLRSLKMAIAFIAAPSNTIAALRWPLSLTMISLVDCHYCSLVPNQPPILNKIAPIYQHKNHKAIPPDESLKCFNSEKVLHAEAFGGREKTDISPYYVYIKALAIANKTEQKRKNAKTSVFPLFSSYVFALCTAVHCKKKICEVKRKSKSVANYLMLLSASSSSDKIIVTNLSSRMLVNNDVLNYLAC